MITGKELKDSIKESLGLVDEKRILTESYVTTQKEYDLATELLSEKTKKSHKELYLGYIEKLNKVSAQLDTADRGAAGITSAYRSLKVSETENRNAVYLHELYFANISDVESMIAHDNLSYMRLVRDFGSFDDWQWDMIACCMSARSGWAVTAYDTFLRRYTNFVIDNHHENIPLGCYPIIVIDLWEHAYYRDYQENKELYVKNMMRELNWEIIEKRIEKAESIAKVLTR